MSAIDLKKLSKQRTSLIKEKAALAKLLKEFKPDTQRKKLKRMWTRLRLAEVAEEILLLETQIERRIAFFKLDIIDQKVKERLDMYIDSIQKTPIDKAELASYLAKDMQDFFKLSESIASAELAQQSANLSLQRKARAADKKELKALTKLVKEKKANIDEKAKLSSKIKSDLDKLQAKLTKLTSKKKPGKNDAKQSVALSEKIAAAQESLLELANEVKTIESEVSPIVEEAKNISSMAKASDDAELKDLGKQLSDETVKADVAASDAVAAAETTVADIVQQVEDTGKSTYEKVGRNRAIQLPKNDDEAPMSFEIMPKSGIVFRDPKKEIKEIENRLFEISQELIDSEDKVEDQDKLAKYIAELELEAQKANDEMDIAKQTISIDPKLAIFDPWMKNNKYDMSGLKAHVDGLGNSKADKKFKDEYKKSKLSLENYNRDVSRMLHIAKKIGLYNSQIELLKKYLRSGNGIRRNGKGIKFHVMPAGFLSSSLPFGQA